MFCLVCGHKIINSNHYCLDILIVIATVEPLNDGHIGDEHYVHCSEIVPSSEVVMYGNI